MSVDHGQGWEDTQCIMLKKKKNKHPNMTKFIPPPSFPPCTPSPRTQASTILQNNVKIFCIINMNTAALAHSRQAGMARSTSR